MIVADLICYSRKYNSIFSKTFEILIEPASLAVIRFIGANFYMLASGILDSISQFFYRTNKDTFFWGGFLIAVVIHGIFDFS